MSSRPEPVTPKLLRDWPLPAVGDSKYSRGQVVIVGGAASSPGAALLAGVASLRIGAGRLALAVDRSVATAVAVALPECAVIPLSDSLHPARDELAAADAVLLGPGLDDADRTLGFVADLVASTEATVVLDAFALGVLPRSDVETLQGRLILTPNKVEAALLLDADEDDLDLHRDVPRIAERFGATVTCYGIVSDGNRVLQVDAGGAGLGTSGSGDVLAGAITGLAARGADPLQAAVYGTWAHAASGDRLEASIGPLGFLARELADELPRTLCTL